MSRTEIKIMCQMFGFAVRAIVAAIEKRDYTDNHIRMMQSTIDNILSDEYNDE